MTNIIRFEIATDAPYSEDEKDALLEDFLDFMKGADGDVIEGTESVKIVSKDDAKKPVISDEQRKEIIGEFLADTTISVSVVLQDGDGLVVGKANFND
ncbi:hypothetical protein [Streptomyces griseosporeus]|uniref:hypothetical protein n=1 Tax=Streptomyces griseosporeus TaxID=1910 RepID=UPI00167E6919|nr:hypothetical protein [Streptomyces griseosporeus]GHF92231.1 hypothetical protein GCM10018783_73860 [Streptomyces griseosporeus]